MCMMQLLGTHLLTTKIMLLSDKTYARLSLFNIILEKRIMVHTVHVKMCMKNVCDKRTETDILLQFEC